MSDTQLRTSLTGEGASDQLIDGISQPVSLFARSGGVTTSSIPQSDALTSNSFALSSSMADASHAGNVAASGGPAMPVTDMHSALMEHGTEAEIPHHDDPREQMAHAELLKLVPHSQATHIAIKDGSWFNASTWQGGKVPTNGAHVLIQEGVSVTYDQESNARLETIRVDGALKFSSQVNTKVLVDTFVIAPEGELQIGSETDPVRANVKAQIIFTADGAIDRSVDPTLLGRGLISHGKARIYGADKSEFLALQSQATAGDNVIVLKEVPQGWRVGDQLVLGGTEYRYGQSDADNSRFRDEELTITGISGNRVFFTNNDTKSGNNTVLRFDHKLPDVAEKDQLELYVANTTRNISFETENAGSVPTQERAHVAFLHNPDVVVENAGFYNLGRTDKTKVVDDPGTNVDGSVGGGTNPRGRYALHFHRTGADDIAGTPAIARGNAVVGSPGWGIVHHDSNAVLEENVVFDVVGAGIVAESGNEIGVWRNNLTIKTTGVNYDNVSRTRDERGQKFDLGFKGEGYWIQGAAQVALVDNIAISANDAGVAVFGDTLNPEEDFRDKQTIAVNLLPPEIRALVAPSGQTEVDVTDIPLRQLTGFRSYNTGDGIFLWGHKTNFDGQLDFDSPDPKTAHTLRSTIDGFAVWGVRDTGVKVEYSSYTDIKNGLIIGNPKNPSGTGIFNNHLSYNIDFDNLTVKGFDNGFKLELLKEDKDFISSSIANSYFSNNTYNFSPIGGERIDEGRLADDFPQYFKIINTQFGSPANNADPVARFSTKVVGGLAVEFNAGTSFDSDPLKPEGKTLTQALESNAIAAYGWDFNSDGTIDKFGRQVSNYFGQAGSKQVSLTVWDNQGATHTLTKTVNVQLSNYINPFVDSSFSSTAPFGAGYKATSVGSKLGWLAPEWVRRGDGAAILSNTSRYGSSIAQVVQDNRIRRGTQTLGLRLKNTEGAGAINNDIEITLWGVNGQFKNSVYEKANPYKAGTLPLQTAKLADLTLGGENFDWKTFRWNVDLKNGYQFLLFQVNTTGTKDAGDYVALDDVQLFSDGTSTPTPSPFTIGDNRYALRGTAGNDSLSGSDRRQVLDGGDGNDTLIALGGDDSLYGQQGNDKLWGDLGNDQLYGHEGDDFLNGGAGHDSLYGAQGHDYLTSGSGNDLLYGDIGDDSLYGGDGNDTLNGAQGHDLLYGGIGEGRDSLIGAEGNDFLSGGAGSDTLHSGIGNDQLLGGTGDDTLFADLGNDILVGGAGNDSLNGGEGNDRLTGVNINLTQAGIGEKDILTDWEAGQDIFVLGDANQVYYNDGLSNTLGINDYALIQGFQSETDTIQLHGKASDYSLGAIPQGIELQNGTAIYLQTPGTDELVAVIAYANNPDLNSAAFTYV
jgi:Ca2+-binding RTX toxin-like protein